MAVSFSRPCWFTSTAGKEFFKTVLVLPVAVPALSVVLLWRMVFCEQGIINELFGLQTDWIYGPFFFGAYIRIFVEKHRISDAPVAGGAGEGYRMSFTRRQRWMEPAGTQKLLYITIPQGEEGGRDDPVLAADQLLPRYSGEAYIVAGSYPKRQDFTCSSIYLITGFKSGRAENACGGSPFNHCNRYFSDSLCHQGGRR